jgi:hypothetical protein
VSETRKPAFSGSYAHISGYRIAMDEEMAAHLFLGAEKAKEDRAARMPDEKAARTLMFDAFVRLRELGWNDIIYCPKDGTRFEVIEAGSTGVFSCHYEGEWPNGHFMVSDGQDIYPSSTGPIMFRLYPDDEAKRQAKMAEAREKFRRERGEA